MAVTIKSRFLRHSAKKLRPYARFFVGKSLNDSINKTMLMPQHSAQFIYKALLMARDSAITKEFKPEELVITELQANDGPKIKRMRPNARGRSNKYEKHIAHLVISVDLQPKPKGKAKTETK